MNISTGLVLPKKVIYRASQTGHEILSSGKKDCTESDIITILLGAYSYDANEGKHSGSLIRLQSKDQGKCDPLKKCTGNGFFSEEIPNTKGPGVFFMQLVLKDNAEGSVIFNTNGYSNMEKYILVCCTDGSIRILSAGYGLEANRIHEKACLTLNRESESFESPAMCTSCDISSEAYVNLHSHVAKVADGFVSFIQKLKSYASRLRKFFNSICAWRNGVFEFVWFPVSETRILRCTLTKQPANQLLTSSVTLIATYADGFCAIYLINPSDLRDHSFLHRFKAHNAEIWCSRIHSNSTKGEIGEVVFSTGADDGFWKLWKCQVENSYATVSLISSVEHPAGVVSICSIMPHFSVETRNILPENQLVLVGCYDEYIRLYSLSSKKPELLSKVKVPGGPWRISQYFSIDHPNKNLAATLNVCCNCTNLHSGASNDVSHFLVACMYGGYSIIHYHRKVGLYNCKEVRTPKWTSKVIASAETADTKCGELTYLANWLPFTPSTKLGFPDKEVCGDNFEQSRFITVSYYQRLLGMY
ncbi:WD40 repeat-containing protein [Perkinsela sp. CCAP 1560/4]|nr:WD40 repeat-containing protein [Perkinsela sp. CCAP 1560/4]|eukprot:KNH06102.1 WD40 repeat-containing protein [Perkinsela sp. CCAP 1560/4]